MGNLPDKLESSQENPDAITAPGDMEKCPTRLVSDSPAHPDDPGDMVTFQIENPHVRVAVAIADLIRDESGGIGIALEGAWGAGKTTVINLLRHELGKTGQLAKPETKLASEDPKGNYKTEPRDQRVFAIVPFDAWAHEKDPLRRTFLENLIPELQVLGWINKEEWTKRLDIIGQRREVKRTETFPLLRIWGVLVAASFFLVPIGASLLNASSKDVQFPFQSSMNIAWKFVFGLVLATAPVLILILLSSWALTAKAWKKRTSKSGNKENTAQQDYRLWTMLFSKIVTSERTETFKTPNPTSVEFETEFKALLAEALEGDEAGESRKSKKTLSPEQHKRLRNRHLVLVLDNLDRVDAGDALSIWSTLQTFLGSSYHHPPVWSERLWNIVLYDPNGVRALWDKNAVKSSVIADPQLQITRTEPPEASGDQVDSKTITLSAPTPIVERTPPISSSFLDKSFRIRFEVPPPVLSDWREYLMQFLKMALPKHSSNEFHEVHSVLAIQSALSGELPTIRELKLFVNQIGATHRQWAVPSSSINKESQLEIPGSSGITDRNPTCRFSLKDIAYYVLAKRRGVDLVEGLRDGSYPENEYRDILSDNATETLAAMAFNVEVKKARQILLGTPIEKALLTADGKELANLAGIHGEGFWDVLQSVVKPRWFRNDANRILAAAAALSRSTLLNDEKPPLSQRVLKSLCRAASDVSAWSPFDRETGEILAELWMWGHQVGDARTPAFTTNLIRSIALSVLALGDRKSIDLWYDGLNIVLERVKRSEGGYVDIPSLIVQPIADQLLADPKESIEIQPSAFAACLQALFKLEDLDEKSSKGALDNIGGSGLILHKLHIAIEASNYVAAAWCFFVFLRHSPDANETASVGASDQGYKYLLDQLGRSNSPIIGPFTDLLVYYTDEDLLFRILDRVSHAGPFVGGCFEQLVRVHDPFHLFVPQVLTDRWAFLSSMNGLPDTAREILISKLVNKSEPARTDGNLVEFVLAGAHEPSLLSLYEVMVQVSPATQSEQLRHWCLDALRTLGTDEWLQQLKENGDFLQHLFAVSSEKQPIQLTNYIAAISDYARLLIENGKAMQLPQSPLSHLKDQDRVAVRDDIRKLALEADGEISEGFFDVFGSEMSDADFLLGHAAENASLLFLPIVRKSNLEGLKWILKTLKTIPSFWKPFSATEIGKVFMSELSERRGENLTAEARSFVDEIMKFTNTR